jgi:hypothetical protein
MVEEQCELCDGKGKLTSNLLTTLLEFKARARQAEAKLETLENNLHCYFSTRKDPGGEDAVPGFPGASPYPETWLPSLLVAANNSRVRTVAAQIAMNTEEHDRFHREPTPKHACPATNGRKYCAKCNPDFAKYVKR